MKKEIYRFLFVTWPQYRNVTWLSGWGPFILSDRPAKFEFHRPYGAGNDDVCNVSSNSNFVSNSNSNAEVPVPRFTNGLFLVVLRNGLKNIHVKNTWFVTCIGTENTAKQSTEKHLYIPHYFCSFYKILRGRCSGDPSFSTFLNQEIHSRKMFEILKGDKKIFQVIYFESFT